MASRCITALSCRLDPDGLNTTVSRDRGCHVDYASHDKLDQILMGRVRKERRARGMPTRLCQRSMGMGHVCFDLAKDVHDSHNRVIGCEGLSSSSGGYEVDLRTTRHRASNNRMNYEDDLILLHSSLCSLDSGPHTVCTVKIHTHTQKTGRKAVDPFSGPSVLPSGPLPLTV